MKSYEILLYGKIGESGFVETVYACHSKRKRDSICRRKKNFLALDYFDAQKFMAKRIIERTGKGTTELLALTPPRLLGLYLEEYYPNAPGVIRSARFVWGSTMCVEVLWLKSYLYAS